MYPLFTVTAIPFTPRFGIFSNNNTLIPSAFFTCLKMFSIQYISLFCIVNNLLNPLTPNFATDLVIFTVKLHHRQKKKKGGKRKKSLLFFAFLIIK